MLFDTVLAPWLKVSNDSALLVMQASGQEQERRNPRLEATLESLCPNSMMAIASVRLIFASASCLKRNPLVLGRDWQQGKDLKNHQLAV